MYAVCAVSNCFGNGARSFAAQYTQRSRVVSALHFVFAWKLRHGVSFGASSLMAVYGGLGISFLAVAVALLVDLQWLSLGWFVTAATVMAIGFWKDLSWLRWGAAADVRGYRKSIRVRHLET